EIIEESLVLSRSFKFVHGSLLYCVYVNNLSCKLLERLHAELANFRPYVGFIPANYSSRAKIYLSTILVNSFLKHGNHVIMGHEDDRPNTENVNIVGLPFEEFGYQISSLQSIYFDLFLSYKIERPVYSGFEVDTEMSLNAITDQIIPLEGCSILVEDAKHKYLLSEKGGKLCKAGIEDIGRNELETLIQSKITASYIYNLVYLEKYNVYKFNLILEISRPDMDDPVKFLVAIEYKPEEKVLRVLTLY
ncbi:MAG: hypothetical protein KAI59_03050, partial [Planctomycetes bacterium]|nr:hypothetical protein [Planctomycetota bacterium]